MHRGKPRHEAKCKPCRAAYQAARNSLTPRKRHPLKAVWRGMLTRCYNTESADYRFYGARGIGVCARWRDSFDAFRTDVGPRPSDKHQIDRIDNGGDYEPTNVRWATAKEQARNRRSNVFIEWRGQRKTIAEWAESYGITRQALRSRLAATAAGDVFVGLEASNGNV